jgi:integrase/recombinase XerD
MRKEGQARILNDAQLKIVTTIARNGRNGLRDALLLDFSFKLGLRAKELAALKITDVTDSDGSIPETFYLRADQTKGNDGRAVYLTNKDVRKHLAEYLATREGDTRSPFLFKSQKTAFNSDTIQKVFKRLYKNAGIEGCSSHSGRRTFATNLIEKGIDLKTVSTLLGHANIQTTLLYVQLNPLRIGAIMADL